MVGWLVAWLLGCLASWWLDINRLRACRRLKTRLLGLLLVSGEGP